MEELIRRGIWGRGLRFVLVGELMTREEMTVAEMVAWLAGQGYVLRGRASKVVSDSLRWEVRRGRVIRVGHGRYRFRGGPASTVRRIRLFAARCRQWIAAVVVGEQPPPTPPNDRAVLPWHRHGPEYPPWDHMGWIWSS